MCVCAVSYTHLDVYKRQAPVTKVGDITDTAIEFDSGLELIF